MITIWRVRGARTSGLLMAVESYGTVAGERSGKEIIVTMPLFMDHHKHVAGLTADAVADAHRKDEEVQERYGVRYLKYWFNEETGEVFCLAEAPDKEAAEAVHREAHGLLADEITEVEEGVV